MDEETEKEIKGLKFEIQTLKERLEALKLVLYNYLEAGCNIALSSVKANLKNL